MRRQLVLGVAALVAFSGGAGAAHLTLYRALHLNVGVNAEDQVAPPRSFLATVTLVQIDTSSHSLLVDALDPYTPTSTIRLRIVYDASTTLQSGTHSMTTIPMTDAATAMLTPGEPLFIMISREAGPLRAQTIRLPLLHRLLSSPS